MSGAKFTPGEWLFVDDIQGTRVVADGHGFSAPYRREPGSGRCEQQAADNRLIAAAKDLHAFTEAALLFHGGGDWSDAKQIRWEELTGSIDATTRVLCDFGRAALAKAGGQ
jgi:hypothetical protein